jgi:hypothetical protein
LISLEVDAGLTFKGLFPDRELDVLGAGVSYGRIGNVRRLDRDENLYTGIERPIRDYETVLEITYEAHCAMVVAAAGSPTGLPSRRFYYGAGTGARGPGDPQCFGHRYSIRYQVLSCRRSGGARYDRN